MVKINFNKYLNPCDEQEFIELSYEILKEFNINTKVYIDFNEELKYLTLDSSYQYKHEVTHGILCLFCPLLCNLRLLD